MTIAKPDKVRVTASYDIAGACTSIEIGLNYDGISREELIEAIRVAFHPMALTLTDTKGHHDLGETAIIPVYQQSNGERIPPGETTSRLTIGFPQK